MACPSSACHTDRANYRRARTHASHRAQMTAFTPLGPYTYGDLESPGALLEAAKSLARVTGNHKELIMMATGPDDNSIAVTNTSLVSLAKLGMRKHVLLLTDSFTTCELVSRPPGPCFWSSRMLRTRPADSLTLRQFWDLRFRFYYMKKKYMALLVAGGYSVLQVDTDTVWQHDPFRVLRQMESTSIVCMRDVGLANAGIVYARPGTKAAMMLLEEVAWRVQLMQHHPEIVGKLFPWAKSPYYANSDDQTILNDAIVSAVIGNRTFLGSTARYEARNKYNQQGPEWSAQPESKQSGLEMRKLWRSQRAGTVTIPWGDANAKPGSPTATNRRTRYIVLPIGDNDGVALAPRALFAHLPYTPHAAITHLTAARGYRAKVSALQRIKKWDPMGSQEDSGKSDDGDDVGGLGVAPALFAENKPAKQTGAKVKLGGSGGLKLRDFGGGGGGGKKGGGGGGGGGGYVKEFKPLKTGGKAGGGGGKAGGGGGKAGGGGGKLSGKDIKKEMKKELKRNGDGGDATAAEAADDPGGTQGE